MMRRAPDMRVLVMGNSHVGAVARAAMSAPAGPTMEVEFLAAEGRTLSGNLRIEGHEALVQLEHAGKRWVAPPSMDRAGRLDLRQYDRIVVLGFQLVSGGSGRNWIDVLVDAGKPYSSALWHAYGIDSARRSHHFRIVSGIGDRTLLARTISLPSPFPNIAHPGFRRLEAPPPARIAAFLATIESEMTEAGVTYRDTPPELLDPCGYATAARYKSERERDYWHLNRNGGQVLLDYIGRLAWESPRNLAKSVTVE